MCNRPYWRVTSIQVSRCVCNRPYWRVTTIRVSRCVCNRPYWRVNSIQVCSQLHWRKETIVCFAQEEVKLYSREHIFLFSVTVTVGSCGMAPGQALVVQWNFLEWMRWGRERGREGERLSEGRRKASSKLLTCVFVCLLQAYSIDDLGDHLEKRCVCVCVGS